MNGQQIKLIANGIGMALQKNAPQIMTATGVAGVIAGTVYACKQTMGLEVVISAFNEADDDINITLLNKEDSGEDDIREAIKSKRQNLLWFAKELASLYGVPTIIMLTSLSLLVGSNVILWRRNAALSAAFTMVSKAYAMYRERVREEFGEDTDEYIRNRRPNGKKMHVADETGKPVNFHDQTDLESEEADIRDELLASSPYSVIFDSRSPQWRPEPTMNEFFLRAQERYANDKLNANGHLFLNEVYDMLGVKRTQEGSVVGWVRNGNGDNFVDFDIYNARNSVDGVMVNSGDQGYYLDFNVDGLIWNLL